MGFLNGGNSIGLGGITQEQLEEQLILKVDKVEGKGLSTNDYTTAEKTKLNGIANGANNYTHPANHPASVITQDATNRFVSDTEKSKWNGKADKTVATIEINGLMSKEDKTKLEGIDDGANNYVHPASHPASIITQTATARFTTDVEKATWNGKADKTLASTTVAGLVKKCAIQADSTATTIEELLVDFNSLLAKMKSAGLM